MVVFFLQTIEFQRITIYIGAGVAVLFDVSPLYNSELWQRQNLIQVA